MQHKLLSMFFSCFCIVALFCFTDLVSMCSASAAKQTSAEAAPSASHITSDVAAMSFDQRQALKLLNNDRKEKGLAEHSAIQELAATLEVPVRALIDIDDLISYLAESSPNKDATQLAKMQHYRAQYGV